MPKGCATMIEFVKFSLQHKQNHGVTVISVNSAALSAEAVTV